MCIRDRGIGTPITISAEQGLGLGDMLDEVTAYFGETGTDADESVARIAVVGKPNVGKSSLVNALLGHERTIVSDIPGTTRDAVDSPFDYNGESLSLIHISVYNFSVSTSSPSLYLYLYAVARYPSLAVISVSL